MATRTRTPWNRRDALKGMGLAVAGLTVGCKSDDDDSGAPPLEGFDLVRERIDTVVVLMMENRSFDHYFGALSLEEGRTDVEGLNPNISNPQPDGTPVAPFHSSEHCVVDPPHSWNDCHAQFNNGLNDGFVTEFADRSPSKAAEAMGYFNRQDLPALYALSDAYTLCDAWFCSLLSSTQPNRFYFHCGQNDGALNNDPPVGKDYPSIYTVLIEAGHTWSGYYANLPGLVLIPDIAIADKNLKFIDQFFVDAAAGTLPNLVFVEPVYGRNDDHPPAHPTAGQIFIAQIYEALANSPQWERIAFFVTYDEHGGFHDHVPPPKAPDALADQGFDQLGFRVPGLVIGPWVKPGHVSHTVYDHTSMLAFIENLFQVAPLSLRDAAADPMLDAFDLEAMRKNMPIAPIQLAPIEADESVIYADECTTDGSDLRMGGPVTGQPELEAHIRAHCAGTTLDRIDQTDAIYEGLLERAERSGILIRRA